MARKIPQRTKPPATRAKTASQAKKPPHAEKAAQDIAPQQSSSPETRGNLFPIVCVGASAGGLEAFTAFLHYLPADTGMAFVLIQHLDPRQRSGLTELLSKATKMPVLEIAADTPIEPNCIYVISPNVLMSITDGQIRVEARGSGRNLPIDYFMRSLASDNTSKAIGIVLSGTASDGTLGLKAVKAEGGITFAQEPSSAKFDGMPRSAIAAGVVDFVLTPEDIAKRLVRIARHPYIAKTPEDGGQEAYETELALNRMFQLLRSVTGNDFTHYKRTTIRRRLHRRMVLHANETLAEYITYLQENPAEVRALADDLLICVTAFFREPEYFEALTNKVFPEVLKDRSPENSIRVWVPGCATGEEAYSIAICLTEFLERAGASVPLQIFASDISETAIGKARAGIYAISALSKISPARLKRFFVKANGGYQIAKSIRDSCIFARQNVTKDPPFHNLDLISCSNVLIYFEPVLQKKVLATFHYALKASGVLVLGPSESVGPLSQAFLPLDKKLKIYVKQPSAEPLKIPATANEPVAAEPAGSSPASGNVRVTLDIQKAAERMLLAQYAPAGVIVDDALNVVHVRGDTGPYLQVAPGEPTYNLLKMVREGLLVGLRQAVLKAKQKKAAVSQQTRVKLHGQLRDVNLKVVPINGPGCADARHFMVLFEDADSARAHAPEDAGQQETGSARPAKLSGGRSARENAPLKQELAATREYLQSIIEDQEAATEELKSANEEAQASNEELETAKEELQSTNEELNTLNDELKTRNIALTEVNSDLSNVLASINVPLVMVGKDLSIRRFTQAMESMLNLIDSDVGRSISDLKPNIDVPDLPELLRGVVAGGRPAEVREIQGPNGRWYYLQAVPYRAPDNKIDGAVLVMFDIDAVRHTRDYAEAMVETVPQPLLVLSSDLKVTAANRSFYETFRVSINDTENRFIYDLGNGQWNIPKLRQALQEVLPKNVAFRSYEVSHKFDNIGQKTMQLSARRLQQLTPYNPENILLAIEDITERKRAEEQIRTTNDDLKHFAYAASHDLQEPLRMVTIYSQLLAREYKGKLDKHADQYIAYAVEGAERMEGLLKGMREFWQASESAEEHRTTIDCNEVVKKVMLNLHNNIADSGAIVTHAKLPTVWAEEMALVQVFQNLVGNAVKYRNKKPPEVHVSAGKNDKGEWVFSVRDNGIGIDPQYAEKIFGMFNRLNGRKYPGSGIGLAISRKVVERLGGRIWVESKPGRGADFKFTIPPKD